VSEQVERMNQIVTYQLNRATKSTHSKMLVSPVAISPVLTKISAALNKVYIDKNIKLEMDVSTTATFYGEESDLTELLGNLMDNAYKYCQRQVRIQVQNFDKNLHLEIDERGARADSREAGQGIGLAVALDIISSYGGELKVENSVLGGASIHVQIRYN
jgi:two-component system, OmpR family, sensor histidine kinase PhoQ